MHQHYKAAPRACYPIPKVKDCHSSVVVVVVGLEKACGSAFPQRRHLAPRPSAHCDGKGSGDFIGRHVLPILRALKCPDECGWTRCPRHGIETQ